VVVADGHALSVDLICARIWSLNSTKQFSELKNVSTFESMKYAKTAEERVPRRAKLLSNVAPAPVAGKFVISRDFSVLPARAQPVRARAQ